MQARLPLGVFLRSVTAAAAYDWVLKEQHDALPPGLQAKIGYALLLDALRPFLQASLTISNFRPWWHFAKRLSEVFSEALKLTRQASLQAEELAFKWGFCFHRFRSNGHASRWGLRTSSRVRKGAGLSLSGVNRDEEGANNVGRSESECSVSSFGVTAMSSMKNRGDSKFARRLACLLLNSSSTVLSLFFLFLSMYG